MPIMPIMPGSGTAVPPVEPGLPPEELEVPPDVLDVPPEVLDVPPDELVEPPLVELVELELELPHEPEPAVWPQLQ